MTAPAAFLVWIAGRNGRPPAPELWPVDAIGATTAHVVELARHPLTNEEAALSINELVARHPAPPVAAADAKVKIA